MHHRLWRLVLLGAPLLVSASEPSAATEHALAEDAACDVGEASCVLELRQLRARGAAASVQLPTELPTAEPAAEDEDTESGLPGGWGEAAELQRERQEADALGIHVVGGGNNTMLKDFSKLLTAAHGHASCAAYGCPSYYVAGRRCQCHSGCVGRGNCCYDFYTKCKHWGEGLHRTPRPASFLAKNIKTVYHATSPEAGRIILKTGFRPGTQGWCGGGIYFAESAEATKTKAIGPDSRQGFIIKAVVDVGRVKHMPPTCDRQLTAQALRNEHFDSVSFDPGDGREWMVYSQRRILSMKQYR